MVADSLRPPIHETSVCQMCHVFMGNLTTRSGGKGQGLGLKGLGQNSAKRYLVRSVVCSGAVNRATGRQHHCPACIDVGRVGARWTSTSVGDKSDSDVRQL